MKSGRFYPNRFVRITLEALEEVIGRVGMQTIYNHAGLPELCQSFPSDDMNKEFDFSDLSKIFDTMHAILGERGAKTLALRAGKRTFVEAMSFFRRESIPGNTPGTGPLGTHTVNMRLVRLANFINSVSDQKCSVQTGEDPDTHIFVIQVCPLCMDRKSERPVCGFFEGLLSEAATAFSGGLGYDAREIQCMANGAESCQFEISLIESEDLDILEKN